MRSRLAPALGFLLLIAGAAGCTGTGVAQHGDIEVSDVEREHLTLAQAPEADSVIAATRKLGLDVLQSMPGQTVVTSPASAVVALSMLGSGASGDVDEQFAAVLGAAGLERDRAVNALTGSLDTHSDQLENIDPKSLPDKAQLHLANQVVVSDRATIERSYLDSLAEWFDAGVLVTDLSSSHGKEQLDEWVRLNTAGLVDQSAIEPSADLRMVLQNAVLFVAKWQVEFSPEATAVEPFTLSDGTPTNADFMHGQWETGYAKVSGWQMLDLPYASAGGATDGTLTARYVLPPEGTELSSVTPELIDQLESQLQPSLVQIAVPKLTIKSTVQLDKPLQQAGLTDIFSPDPPSLRYISESDDLFVTEVVQQGLIQVDEGGTVAAAVTEIGVEATGAPVDAPVEFRADRPHLILLLDEAVGWDLFQIQVNDPKAP